MEILLTLLFIVRKQGRSTLAEGKRSVSFKLIKKDHAHSVYLKATRSARLRMTMGVRRL